MKWGILLAFQNIQEVNQIFKSGASNRFNRSQSLDFLEFFNFLIYYPICIGFTADCMV